MVDSTQKSALKRTNKHEEIDLWSLWNRRQSTKFNGVSYIVQRGAEAVYSEEGQIQIKKLVSFYMDNAQIIKEIGRAHV